MYVPLQHVDSEDEYQTLLHTSALLVQANIAAGCCRVLSLLVHEVPDIEVLAVVVHRSQRAVEFLTRPSSCVPVHTFIRPVQQTSRTVLDPLVTGTTAWPWRWQCG